MTHFFVPATLPTTLPATLKRLSALGSTPVMMHGGKAAADVADRYARVSWQTAGLFCHPSELEMARRYGLPVLVVIDNNRSMNQAATFWDAGTARPFDNGRTCST